MKKVNKESKAILDKLWEFAEKNDGYCKLDNNTSYMSLSIEIVEKTIISLCHYGEQNGDLMRDPEMLFWRDTNNDYYSYYFRNDYICVEEIIGEVVDDNLSLADQKKQSHQTEFANIWLVNIKYQQLQDK